jgi:hypothetical protein
MSRADKLRSQLAQLNYDIYDGKKVDFTKYRRIEQQLHDEVHKA